MPRTQAPLRRDARENQERVLAAAAAAVLRVGPHVPMSTIASEAGVGIATLYRRYPDRTALLDALTHRSFELLVDIAQAAQARPGTARECLSWWWDRVIDVRGQLVLPLGGGPAAFSTQTSLVQSTLHKTLSSIVQRGHREGSIRTDVSTGDVIVFGAMLVRPLPGAKDWTRTARRHKDVYVDGLAHTSSRP